MTPYIDVDNKPISQIWYNMEGSILIQAIKGGAVRERHECGNWMRPSLDMGTGQLTADPLKT
jgi:hypothetical protein